MAENAQEVAGRNADRLTPEWQVRVSLNNHLQLGLEIRQTIDKAIVDFQCRKFYLLSPASEIGHPPKGELSDIPFRH